MGQNRQSSPKAGGLFSTGLGVVYGGVESDVGCVVSGYGIWDAGYGRVASDVRCGVRGCGMSDLRCGVWAAGSACCKRVLDTGPGDWGTGVGCGTWSMACLVCGVRCGAP